MTEERIGFLRDIWDRKTEKVIDNLTPARIKWGEKIFEGFTDGSFSKTIDGKVKNISCRPESEDYYPGWRELIVQKSQDLLERLWQVVVEGSEVETAQEGPPEKK
jgi:hypothetical protein